MISEEEKQVKSYPEAATTSSVEIQNWIEAQDLLKKKLIKEDEFEGDSLKYVGGVDISFLKEDSSVACGPSSLGAFGEDEKERSSFVSSVVAG